MAKSISQAQAEAIAEGFFDNLGEDFKPKKSLSAIIRVAGAIVQEAQDNLNSSDRVATGALSESITIEDPIKEGNSIRIDISMLYYWKFINDGVRGVISKLPNSKYSFKNLFVGKKMLDAIKKWLRREGLKTRATGQGKAISKRERKRRLRKVKKDELSSAAYSVSLKVKSKGLKKTNFLTKALKEGNRIAQEEIGKGFKADIIDTIPKKI